MTQPLKLENQLFGTDLIKTKDQLTGLLGEREMLIKQLHSKMVSLRKSREDCIRKEQCAVNKEMVAKYAAQFEKLRRHRVETEKANEVMLTLSQITGTNDCLKILMVMGVEVPSAELERLATDKAKWEAKLDAVDVIDLVEADLTATPFEEVSPTSMGPQDVLPMLLRGVNPFGLNSEVISSADTTNLRNQLGV